VAIGPLDCDQTATTLGGHCLSDCDHLRPQSQGWRPATINLDAEVAALERMTTLRVLSRGQIAGVAEGVLKRLVELVVDLKRGVPMQETSPPPTSADWMTQVVNMTIYAGQR
jgi:hypothetical protein